MVSFLWTLIISVVLVIQVSSTGQMLSVFIACKALVNLILLRHIWGGGDQLDINWSKYRWVTWLFEHTRKREKNLVLQIFSWALKVRRLLFFVWLKMSDQWYPIGTLVEWEMSCSFRTIILFNNKISDKKLPILTRIECFRTVTQVWIHR